MAAPRPGNPDRGWNDPPVFDYQSSNNSSTTLSESPRRTVLNKRVAYPLSSDQSSPTGTCTLLNPVDGPPRLPPVQILPPTTTINTPTPVPLVIPSLSPTADPCGDPPLEPVIISPEAGAMTAQPVLSSDNVFCTKSLKDLLDELSLHSEESLLDYVKEGLHSAADSVKQSLQGRALEDVKRKLLLMEEWWAAGKISDTVKTRIGSLVAALKKKCLEEAHEIHLALMINHTQEVHQWLVGINHIIQEMRTSATGGEVQEEGADQPVLDPCLTLEYMTGLQPEEEGAQQAWSLSGPTQVMEKEPQESSGVDTTPSHLTQTEQTEDQS